MAQKRLSAQEKADIMLKIFQSKRDIFHIKEIEKLSVKRGIILQSVKDVLQSLIDDNLVIQEKLGISNYYWSFPRDEGSEILNQIKSTNDEIDQLEKEIKSLKKQLIDSCVGREASTKRDELIKETTDIDEILLKQENDMKRYVDCDPRVFEQRRNEVIKIKNEINGVTEDIFQMQSYVTQKFGMDRRDFNESFGIDEEMDLVEI